MSSKSWHVKAAVVVCGVHENDITDDGSGVQRFRSLAAAHAVFPDLDPVNPTARFTGAMNSHHHDEMRFETHQACQFYTSRFPQRTTHKRSWERPVRHAD